MTAIDLGCGPGFFTIEMTNLLNGKGKIIAADLQQGMLDKLHQKIIGTSLESIIDLHKCTADKIGISTKADFVLAFYMVHEVPDQEKLFAEIKTFLKPKGRLLIIEPNFHVSKKAFVKMSTLLNDLGFNTIAEPKIFFSKSIVVANK